jgi:hypothetical protein
VTRFYLVCNGLNERASCDACCDGVMRFLSHLCEVSFEFERALLLVNCAAHSFYFAFLLARAGSNGCLRP